MTESRPLNRILDSFFEQGPEELSDRVLASALEEIDHIPQRRRLAGLRRFPTMTPPTRLAAAAVIGVVALGGAFYLLRPADSIGPPPATLSPTPRASASTTDTPASAWQLTGPPGVDRGVRGVTVQLLDGRVLLAGGTDGASSSAELYDPATGTWAPTGLMGNGRSYPGGVRLDDGRVLVVGGFDGRASLWSAEIYDPATGTWSFVAPMYDPRQQLFAVLLEDGRVLVGGGGTDQGLSPTTEIYDPQTDTWARANDMSVGRAGPLTARLLADGRVLVTGGFSDDAGSSDLFDPTSGKWTPGPRVPLLSGDEGASVGLAGGTVLLVGDEPSEAAVFDPAGSWEPTAPLMGTYDDLVVAVRLADGRALLVGGSSSSDLAAAELYDPATNLWSAAGRLASVQLVWSATALPSGNVMVVGRTSGDDGTQVAEVLDPSGL